MKNIVLNVFLSLFTLALGLCIVEGVLRIKHMDQKNYNIEMWRYSKLLKVKSDNKDLGHEHRSKVEANLQGVKINLNSLGMRGPEPDLENNELSRILILGSSNVLGWGIPEEDTLAANIRRELKGQAQVFNAGIGNYNAHRYISLLESRLLNLNFDTVIIQYFINDAEIISPPRSNIVLRNSHLAVLIYQAYNTFKSVSKVGGAGLEDYYRAIYEKDHPGRIKMEEAMKRLNQLSQAHHFKVIFTIVPDIHNLKDYPFDFAHSHMQEIARKYQWTFVDFKTSLSSVSSSELWAMQGDPHLNSLGNKIISQTLVPYLKQ